MIWYIKVQIFWEGYKNLKKSPNFFELTKGPFLNYVISIGVKGVKNCRFLDDIVYGRPLSSNEMGDFFIIYVAFWKYQSFNKIMEKYKTKIFFYIIQNRCMIWVFS